MIRLCLEALAIVLSVAFAGGLWCRQRRRRLLTERDFQQAEQWRHAAAGVPPTEEPLLAALDAAWRAEEPPTTDS